MIDFLFSQYDEYSALHITLELIAIAAGVVSVLFSARNSVLVYPFGLIGTGIFVYLLIVWGLLGDMIINGYYFIMSIYGWYQWTSDVGGPAIKVSRTSRSLWIKSVTLFIVSMIGVYLIYISFNMLKSWMNYLDILTTGIAFVGMYLMALRKIEHWLVLLLANVLSIPLYFLKGYTFSSFLYIFLAIMAVIGYLTWKKKYFKKVIVVQG